MTGIYKIVDAANNLLWGKNILVFMLIGAALYFHLKLSLCNLDYLIK